MTNIGNKNGNRDVKVALIITAISVVGGFAIAFTLVSAYPIRYRYSPTSEEDLGRIVSLWSFFCVTFGLWADHRLRQRHRLAWYWSTYWRVLVASIGAAFCQAFTAELVDNGIIHLLLTYCITALFLYAGLRSASGVYEGVLFDLRRRANAAPPPESQQTAKGKSTI